MTDIGPCPNCGGGRWRVSAKQYTCKQGHRSPIQEPNMTEKTIDLDFFGPTHIAAPPPGMELELRAHDKPLNFQTGGYWDQPLHAGHTTVIRHSAILTCTEPGVKVTVSEPREIPTP